MKDKFSPIIAFLIFIFVLSSFSKSNEKEVNYNVIRKIEISKNMEICNILNDVMSEEKFKESSDSAFYVIDLIDYEDGTIIGVHLIPNNRFIKNDNCIGYDQYNGHTIIVNGDESHLDNFYVESPDVLKLNEHSKIPTPDGSKGWTYFVKDENIYRYFMGMGWMLLPDSKNEKQCRNKNTIILPKRKNLNNP